MEVYEYKGKKYQKIQVFTPFIENDACYGCYSEWNLRK